MANSTKLTTGSGFYTTDSTFVDEVVPTNCYSLAGKNVISLGASTIMGSLSLSFKGDIAINAFTVHAAALVTSGTSIKVSSSSANVAQSIDITSKTDTAYSFSAFGNNTSVTPVVTLLAVGKISRLSAIDVSYTIGTSVPGTAIAIDQDPIKVAVGEYNTQTLTASFTPANTTYQGVAWSSADPTIAAIDATTGVLTGIKAGTTKVTATAKVGAFSATKDVVVYDPNNNLLVFDNDFSEFGGNAKAADRSGTNYASKSSTLNYTQVEAASDTAILHGNESTAKILVIPVHVKGEDTNATETVRSNIYKTMFGKPSETGWESVSSFYYKSSYQQLKLEGEVTEWYDLPYTKTELAALTNSSWGKTFNPTWTALEKAVSWAKERYNTDLTSFDNDKDGYLDGVWMVYSCDYDTTNTDLWWAFTYNDYDKDPVVASPVGSKYCWASYNFMNEGYSGAKVDAHTYIHETGHMMGLDDYYTYDGTVGPVGGLDMMDYNIIDHDAYSKFALGWTKPMVVSGPTEITLNSLAETGESILIPTGDSWNGTAFDEYLLLEYYTPTVLNKQDSETAYAGNSHQGFTKAGVRIFHVDARLVTADYSGSWGSYSYTDTIKYVKPYTDTDGTYKATYTYVGASNSVSRSKTGLDSSFKLISLISADNVSLTKSGATNASLFEDGDTFSVAKYGANFLAKKTTMNDGTTEPYTLAFSDSTASSIKVTVAAA
jgi:M6 family metalloprotease-like protein